MVLHIILYKINDDLICMLIAECDFSWARIWATLVWNMHSSDTGLCFLLAFQDHSIQMQMPQM